MSDLGNLTLVAVLAVLVEMLVEYFVKPLLPASLPDDVGGGAGPTERAVQRAAAGTGAGAAQWWLTLPYARFAAAAIGVALCLLYQVDALAMMLPDLPRSYAGMVLTGLLISRGSNYVHDWLANPTVRP